MPPYSISTTLPAPAATSLLPLQSFGGNSAPSFSQHTLVAFPSAGAESIASRYHANDPVSVSRPPPSITVTQTAAEPTAYGHVRSALTATPSTSVRRPQASTLVDDQTKSETGDTQKQASLWDFVKEWAVLSVASCTVLGLGTYVGVKAKQRYDENGRRQPTVPGSRWSTSVSGPGSRRWYAPLSSGVPSGSHGGDGYGTELEQLPAEAPPVKADIKDDTACSGIRRPLETYNGGSYVMSATSGERGVSS